MTYDEAKWGEGERSALRRYAYALRRLDTAQHALDDALAEANAWRERQEQQPGIDGMALDAAYRDRVRPARSAYDEAWLLVEHLRPAE